MADNKTSRMFLIVAVVLGVVATVMAFVFMQSMAGADHGPTVKIIVAAHDLLPSATIDPDRDLKVIDMPATFSSLSGATLNPDARASYKNQRLNRRVLTQQPIFLSDISAPEEIELKEPYRAITIPAETTLISPGDYVKIISTHSGVAGAPNDAVIVGADPYLVLAVNGNPNKKITAADQYTSNNGAAKTVTLEVTEDQAREIMKAIGGSQQKNVLLVFPPPAPAQQPATTTGAAR